MHIIVGQTQRNQMPKKKHFWNFIWCDVKVYLKKNVCHNVLKNVEYIHEMIGMI
jgi:hypothetical protein